MKFFVAAFTTCLFAAGCVWHGNPAQYSQSRVPQETNAAFFLEVARSNFNVGRYDVALTNLTKALELNPAYEEAYMARGWTKLELQHDYYGAIADYDKAIALNPRCGGCYCNRGRAKFIFEMVPEALADYNKAIEFDARCAEAYFNRGIIEFVRLTNCTAALGDFTKAIDLHSDPQEADIYFWRGNAKSGLKDYAGSIADYKRSLELDPNGGMAKYATTNLATAEKLVNESPKK